MVSPRLKPCLGLLGILLFNAPLAAQIDVWHIGKGGLSWTSQAQTQIGALDVDGALQPLELQAGQNLIELLRDSGQRFLKGQPSNFTLAGQPRTWTNDAFFDQINGPLNLIDGNEQTSSGSAFKTAQSQAGATFFWDLGAPFPVNRIRFFPDPDDPDAFIKAFEMRINDGENFNDINRPEYQVLRRVEVNRQNTVDLEFAPLQGRFLQLLVLSKTVFNLAEFEIYGEGFVPIASYESSLHSFGQPVNFGNIRLATTRLGNGRQEDKPPTALIQMRTGADDTPLTYFRRNRDTGSQEQVSIEEYNADLPRRALFRQDPETGILLAELDRAAYLELPVEEQGPVFDFVKGDIRDDVDNWSSWSRGILIDSTGAIEVPIDLPSPRQFMQFRVLFDGDALNAVRLDTFQVEFSPALVSQAVGEVALEADPFPANGVLEVEGGVDTTFTYDIRTEFGGSAEAGYRGIRIEAFPPPIFERLEAGDPLAPVENFTVEETNGGFDVFFPTVDAANNRPLRVGFRLRLLEHNTPINAWLLGENAVPPHPVAPGNASDAVGTGVINAFTAQSRPGLQIDLSSRVITPNGDGVNETAAISLIMSQFAGPTGVEVDLFDLGGRRVRRLVSAQRSAGAYSESWDGRNDQGTLVAPGLYLLRVGVEADSETFERVQLIGVAY
jgi:hypothetical protein